MSKMEFLGTCENCPISGLACKAMERRQQAARQAAEVALGGLSDNPDIQLCRSDGVPVDVADLDPEFVGELNKDLRSQAASLLDEVDEDINRAVQFVEDCPGPTTVRFRVKSGDLVRMTVCSNHKLSESGGQWGNLELVRVRRGL